MLSNEPDNAVNTGTGFKTALNIISTQNAAHKKTYRELKHTYLGSYWTYMAISLKKDENKILVKEHQICYNSLLFFYLLITIHLFLFFAST